MLNPDGSFEVIAGSNLLAGLVDPDGRRPGVDAVATERPIVVTATDEIYPAVADALQAARLHSLVAVPLFRGTTPIGVVAAFFARQRDLQDDEVDLILAVTRQAGQTLTRIRLQEELAHLALHDQLTGLANRLLLREHLEQSLATAKRNAGPLSLMFVDLDGFKAVNDQLGHVTGDAVLREVADRIRHVVRDSDVVGRYGGDEFVVICSETDATAAEVIADRIRQAVRAPLDEAPGYPITASIGIAVHEHGSHDASTDQLIDIADSAMYASKKSGRDRATVTRC
jgi:diguanylate cyclase (GGDEF)-like protein